MINDKVYEEWLKIAEKKGIPYIGKSIFQEAPDEIKKDYNLNMIAILKGSEQFYNIHESLKNNENFIKELSQKKLNNNFYPYYPEHFKSNIEIITSVYKHNPEIIRFIPYELRVNKKIIKDLLSINGLGFQYISKEQQEIDICEIAIKNNSKVIRFVTKSQSIKLCNDDLLVEKILNEYPEGIQYLSTKIRNKESIIENLLIKYPAGFQYLSQKNRYDKYYALKAIYADPMNLEFCSNELKADKILAKKLLEETECRLYHFCEELQNDEELIFLRLKKCPHSFKYAPYQIQKNREIVYKAVCVSYWVYYYLSPELKLDTKVIQNLLKHGDEGLKFLHEKIKEEMGDTDPYYYIQQKLLMEELLTNLSTESKSPPKRKMKI